MDPKPKLNLEKKEDIFGKILWNGGESNIPPEVSEALVILSKLGKVEDWEEGYKFKYPSVFSIDGVYVKFDPTQSIEIGDSSRRGEGFFLLARPFTEKKLKEAIKAYKGLEKFASPDSEMEPIASFEMFTYPCAPNRGARSNNFPMKLFLEPDDFFKPNDYVLRFRKEHSDKYTSICEKKRLLEENNPLLFQKPDASFPEKMARAEAERKILQDGFNREIYEAYKIMRSYGATDRDLCA